MTYKVLKADSPINAEQLEQLSRQGWELVEIVEWRGTFYFYFRQLGA